LPELLSALNHYHDSILAESKNDFVKFEVDLFNSGESVIYKILGFNEESLAKLGDNDSIKRWMIEDTSYKCKSINTEVINAFGNNIFNTEKVRARLQEALSKGNKFAATALAKFGITEMAPHLIEILGTNDYEVQLNQIIGLIADLINQSEPSQRNSMILDIIGRLNDPGTHKKYYFVENLAIVLTKVDSGYLIHYLPKLSKMLNRNMGEQILWIIESIQAGCKFYNYDIYRAPSIQPQQEWQCPPSSTTIIEHVDTYIAGDKVLGDKVNGDKYEIKTVGNLNTGNVNIEGNQTGETHDS
jgi:hypothetical protein